MPETQNLMDGLLQEMNRAKEVKKLYDEIPEGRLGSIIIQGIIIRTEKSISSSDVVEMVTMYKTLKSLNDKMDGQKMSYGSRNIDDNWTYIESKKPDQLYLRILHRDGSELNVLSQSDGDFWWKPHDLFIIPSEVVAWKYREKDEDGN